MSEQSRWKVVITKAPKLLLRIMILVVLAIAMWWLRDFVSQDHCLDAGGRWNAVSGVCEGARTQ